MRKADAPGRLMIQVGLGELIDKVTILRIKSNKIKDPSKLVNVRNELETLESARTQYCADSNKFTELEDKLHAINLDLWQIEDDIRLCEANGDFGADFISLARSVYITNDKRAEVKMQINILDNSAIVEEKSYTEFN